MKHLLYIIIITGSFLIPLKKADVAKLQPVEAVVLREGEGGIEIYTDTGAWGSGKNAQEALDDLIKNTPEVVYLDTARYLLVDKQSLTEIDELREELKGNVRLCICNCEGELRDVLKYFSLHEDLPRLKEWVLGENIPEYISEKQ